MLQKYPPISDLPEAVSLVIEIVKADAVAQRPEEFTKAVWTIGSVVLGVYPGEPDGRVVAATDHAAVLAEANRVRSLLVEVFEAPPMPKEGFNPLFIIALIQAVLKILDLFKTECPCPKE